MKIAKLKAAILPALLVIFLISISLIKATVSTTVKVEPHQSFAEVGEAFTVGITLNNVENLYGLEVEIFWNASILNVTKIDSRLGRESHENGVLHEIPSTALVQIYQNKTIQELGKHIIAASSIAPAPSFNGSGNIMLITFTVTSTGTCDIRLAAKLYDKPPPGGESNPISHSYENGTFGPTSDSAFYIYAATAIILIAIFMGSTIYFKRARS
ncbi:MAG: hypothetical protein JSV05_03355 [Candidatus Bathyarchaeota archaeon]|nr:MAG: hypothetical protein JSV05_03355 [Candidatus Bathyarchaeota archaeon]